MNIHKNGESCYLMELSEKEMNFYNITYSNLKNSSDENVKKIILEKCGEKPDRTPEWDILPGITGGCLIIISFFRKTRIEAVVFEFESYDLLLDGVKALSETEKKAKSQLYEENGKPRLILEKPGIKELFILSEFSSCVFSDNTTIENTKKNMKCVIRQKASEILCGKRTKL